MHGRRLRQNRGREDGHELGGREGEGEVSPGCLSDATIWTADYEYAPIDRFTDTESYWTEPTSMIARSFDGVLTLDASTPSSARMLLPANWTRSFRSCIVLVRGTFASGKCWLERSHLGAPCAHPSGGLIADADMPRIINRSPADTSSYGKRNARTIPRRVIG